MKQRAVRFCDGCGHVFDESRPDGRAGRWVEARIYFLAYGVTWDDLMLIDDMCPPCQRVLNCVQRGAVTREPETAHSTS